MWYRGDDDEYHDEYNTPDSIDTYVNEGKHANSATTKPSQPDMEHLQRCLGWKSTDVVTKTLQATTQLAENHVRLPMRMHFKLRFPALNVKRLKKFLLLILSTLLKRPLVDTLVHNYMLEKPAPSLRSMA